MARARVELVSSVGVGELVRRGELRRTSDGGGQVATLSATFQPYDCPIPVRASVSVEWEPCRFGGWRPWFRCPRCHARRARIYLRPTGPGVACRVCHRLAYHSQRLQPNDLAHTRGAGLMRRLGVTGQEAYDLALDPQFAPKPKRMRWATYDRIVAAAEACEERRMAALIPGMEAFLRRLERTASRSRAGR